MLTKAQKKKRDELKKKIMLGFKVAGAVVLLIIGFVYWRNSLGAREAQDGEEVFTSETDRDISGKEFAKVTQTVSELPKNEPDIMEESAIRDNAAVISGSGEAAGATEEPAVTDSLQVIDSEGRVNINLAGLTELCRLNGIGQKRAQDIIDYRDSHGKFSCIEDIMKVKGIKQGIFSKIKDMITCG